MSARSTIFSTNCCHIYKDVDYEEGGERETLNIDVDYLTLGDKNSICVDWNSDFAELIRVVFERIGTDELDRICRNYYQKNLKD